MTFEQLENNGEPRRGREESLDMNINSVDILQNNIKNSIEQPLKLTTNKDGEYKDLIVRGGTAHVGKGQRVTAIGEDSIIYAGDGCLVYAFGSVVYAEKGAKVIAKDGADVYAKPGSIIDARSQTKINASIGPCIHQEPGALVSVNYWNSFVEAYNGAQVSIKGADIHLTAFDGSTIYDDTTKKGYGPWIEAKGKCTIYAQPWTKINIHKGADVTIINLR